MADTYAYCLMRNHLHLLVRIKTPEEQRAAEGTQAPKPRNPSQQFGNLLNAYAKAINKAYQRTGSLFENPFGRVPLTDESHLVYLVTYLHQNPVKHGFVDDFRTWPWSSYNAILSQKPTHLERDEVLAWFQGRAAFADAHRRPAKEAQIASLVIDDLA